MEEEEEREKEEETQEEGRGEREREILIGKMRSWSMARKQTCSSHRILVLVS